MAAGSIVVDLLMKTGSFETDTKRAEKRSKEMAANIDKAFKVAAGAALAAGTAFLAMTKSIVDGADSLAKAARSVGISTESLSALQYAADMSGVSAEELNASLARLNRGAAQGNKAFDAMGISVRDAQGNLKATDTLLKEVSDKFASYRDGAEKSALAQELFGRSGAQMISFLNEGSEGLGRMEAEAKRLGIVISGDLAKNSEALNDNLSRIALAAKGAAIEIAGPLIRALADVTTRFFEASNAGKGFWQSLGVALDPTQGIGSRSSIEQATKDIEGLQKRIQLMAATGATAQNNPMFALLNQQLAQAKINLSDLEKIQRLMGPAAPLGVAPMVGNQDEAKKQRSEYDQWMRSMQEGENRYRLDMIDKRIAAEKKAEEDYQAWMQEMRDGEIQQYLKMQDLKDQRLQESTAKLKAYADQLGMAFGNAFENAIITGQKLSDTLRQLAQDIARLVLRQTVTGPIAEAISGALMGGFGGFRANGGPVTGGGTYMVGERGPELFVPNTSGMIVPHEALQGGGVVNNVSVNVNMQDGSISAQNASLLGGFVAGAVKQELVKQRRAGGLLA